MEEIMKKNVIIVGVILLFVLGICQTVSIPQVAQNNDKLNVIVSILPQKAFVEAVGGNFVNVKELIPPGGSPATYEPKPGDLANVEKADIYFKIGHIPFEKSHAGKLANLNPNMKIIDTSTSVKLRYFDKDKEVKHEHEQMLNDDHGKHSFDKQEEGSHHHKGIDPHIWLSPMQVKKQVAIIREVLSQEDPQNLEIYQKNAEKFKKKLDELHIELNAIFKESKTDKLMVFHPAWGYFADEYNLEQIAIEQDGKEPTAKQLQYIIDLAKEENIKVIFVQKQFDKEIAQSIAEQIGATIISIDPLSGDYLNNLKVVGTKIAESLK